MNILITGGNGYIGKSLLLGLRDRYQVTTVTRADFDVADSTQTWDWFRSRKFDAVIHAAIMGGSRLQVDDSSVAKMNLRMHYNLLANRNKFGKLISFGSGAEIFSPDTPYGFSKRVIANSIRKTPDCHNIRIFGVFDENELSTRFIRSNIHRYLKNEPMQVHSDKIMDFFYMKDLVSVVDKYLTEKDPPKEVNCSYRDKHTLSEIASQINELGHHRVAINIEQAGVSFYCGEPLEMDVPLIGFSKGLIDTFNTLSKEGTTQ
jgi:UDP-glucose 4-epimerase